ncbi:MAG: DUF4007 family protein [Candidatus Paceibacterota bacterium]
MGKNLNFSGHESFQCRNLWPKKGFDFIHQDSGDFHSDEAVLSLGVGKNMTTSIRYWLDAFGFKKQNEKTSSYTVGQNLLANEGWDPYLENIGSLWLLHFELVRNDFASIYSLVFNHFRKYRTEFTKKHLLSFIKSKTLETNSLPADSTLETDIGVFLKTYLQPNSKNSRKNIEDHFSSLLMELSLIKEIEDIEHRDGEKEKWYKFEQSTQETLPVEVFLYSILDNEHFGNSISIQALLNAENSPGSVFLLNPDTVISKIEELATLYERIVYKEDAGIRELQILENIDPIDVLNSYYGRS